MHLSSSKHGKKNHEKVYVIKNYKKYIVNCHDKNVKIVWYYDYTSKVSFFSCVTLVVRETT